MMSFQTITLKTSRMLRTNFTQVSLYISGWIKICTMFIRWNEKFGPCHQLFCFNLSSKRLWGSSKPWPATSSSTIPESGNPYPRFLCRHISPEKTMYIGPSLPSPIGYRTKFPQQHINSYMDPVTIGISIIF